MLKEAVDAAPQATSIQQQAKVLHPMRQRNRVRIARKRTLAKVQRKHIQQDQKYLEDYFAKKSVSVCSSLTFPEMFAVDSCVNRSLLFR